MKRTPDAPNPDRLTEREREVITLVAQGYPDKRIAEKLAISRATVRSHLRSIFDKLWVSDRVELTVFAYKHDLCPKEEGDTSSALPQFYEVAV